jgi:hypothetical protein
VPGASVAASCRSLKGAVSFFRGPDRGEQAPRFPAIPLGEKMGNVDVPGPALAGWLEILSCEVRSPERTTGPGFHEQGIRPRLECRAIKDQTKPIFLFVSDRIARLASHAQTPLRLMISSVETYVVNDPDSARCLALIARFAWSSLIVTSP